jgi:hypothetical protein
VALLCSTALAGIGLATLLRGRSRWARRVMVLIAVSVVAWETWRPPFATMHVVRPEEVDPATRWLATASTARYAELPVDYLLGSTMQQYASIAHFRPTLTGNMGLLPPVFPYLVRRLERFPSADVVGELVSLGFTHVIAHEARLDPDRVQAIASATSELASPVQEVWAQDGTHVYALRGTPSLPAVPTGTPMERTTWRLSASHDVGSARNAIGGDPTTPWQSYGDLERGLREWYDPRSFPERYMSFIGSGPLWLAVDFGHRATVTAVVLRMDGSEPLVAPGLALERSDDGETWRAVPSVLQAWPDVRALVASAANPRFALVPESPVDTRHVRVTAPPLDWRVSDVTVLAVPDEGHR